MTGHQDRNDQTELGKARDQLANVIQQESQLEAARSELQNRERQLDQARHAQLERASRRSELVEDQEQLRRLRDHLEERQQQERESSVPLVELRKAVDKGEAEVQVAEQLVEEWRVTLQIITRSAELSELLRRQDDVSAAQKAAGRCSAFGPSKFRSPTSLFNASDEAANSANQADAQLRVAATRISFDIPSDRLDGI